MPRGHSVRLAVLALGGAVLAATACSGGPAGPSGGNRTAGVVIGSFDFPESVLLAEIYRQALEAKGFPATVRPNVGPRELVIPALEQGLVQFVPEYLGSALDFLNLGPGAATPDPVGNREALIEAFAPRGVQVLTAAPAQDANALAVTRGIARRLGLHTVSDLAASASNLLLGGPPECPRRPRCLPGLALTYGLTFGEFVPLDTGGPLTFQALVAGQIDVALVFTTDPRIARDGLILLADDQHLQPAENVTPVVRADVVRRLGQAFVDAVDAVSRRLTTAQLQAMNGDVSDGRAPAAVARAWLSAESLS